MITTVCQISGLVNYLKQLFKSTRSIYALGKKIVDLTTDVVTCVHSFYSFSLYKVLFFER